MAAIEAQHEGSFQGCFDSFGILQVPVSDIDLARGASAILAWQNDKMGRFVCVRDVHGVMLAQQDPVFMAVHHKAAMVTPDGMPLVWLGKAQGRGIGRVCGADLMEKVIVDGIKSRTRHYFLGGAQGVAALLVNKLNQRYPDLCVAGIETPPFREQTAAENQMTIKRINESAAHIVWIGLSTPKQEHWMAAQYHKTSATLIGVGAAFDFHAGTVARAPKWMQKSGLEWLHRLISQPRRLWRRYLVLAPQFVAKVAWNGLRNRWRA